MDVWVCNGLLVDQLKADLIIVIIVGGVTRKRTRYCSFCRFGKKIVLKITAQRKISKFEKS